MHNAYNQRWGCTNPYKTGLESLFIMCMFASASY